MKLPISEELQTEVESKYRESALPINLDAQMQSEAPENVFLDDCNPLLTQVAIFSRLLEL